MNRKIILLFLIFNFTYIHLASAWPFQSPEEKLRIAETMYAERDRPIRAEVLIYEARAIYEKRRDEVGLAQVDRAYAYFLKSNAVGRWSKMKFYDQSVNHSNRYLKSFEYMNRALKIFENHGLYAYASNIYFNMAALHSEIFSDNTLACMCLERSLNNHIKYRSENHEKVNILTGYNSFEEIIDKAKIEANCSKVISLPEQ